jgi:hypothetical protein
LITNHFLSNRTAFGVVGIAQQVFLDETQNNFLVWCQTLRRFLDKDHIDRTDPAYSECWMKILSPLSFYRRGNKGDPKKSFTKSKPNSRLLTILGKCCLDGKLVYPIIDLSREAFAFCILKGKFRVAPEFLCWASGQAIPGVEKWVSSSDVVKVEYSLEKGVKKSESGRDFNGETPGGVTWGWDDQHVVFFVQVVYKAVAQHHSLSHSVHRLDNGSSISQIAIGNCFWILLEGERATSGQLQKC